MGIIHVLEPNVANMIAAGEVVERPASVIKELVENSIDAGADIITVEIRNGGISYMRVTDNGKGIAPDDIGVAFMRHATSKIRDEKDLEAIYTLGFRGEALSSIAAVSKVVLTTKMSRMDEAVRAFVSGGEMENVTNVGAPKGTTVEVKNIFYNTPARMKFLKKDTTEGNYITEIVEKFVLSHPEISFKLISNGKQVLFSPGDGDGKNAIYAVYGKDYAQNLIDVCYGDDILSVEGYIGKSSISRPNRAYQSFFVNGRYIKSRSMTAALEEAYKNQLMGGRFPFAVLNVRVRANAIDVNVHPHKTEVKFSDERKVFDAVYWGVKNALYQKPQIPEVTVKEKKEAYRFTEIRKADETENKQIKLGDIRKETPPLKSDAKTQSIKSAPVQERESAPIDTAKTLTVNEEKINPIEREIKEVTAKKIVIEELEGIENSFAQNRAEKAESTKEAGKKEKEPAPYEEKTADIEDYRIVGQVFDTYIIIERESEMLIIDQHAAHERLNYEKLKKDIENEGIESQLILGGAVMDLTGAEMEIASDMRDTLCSLGFDFDAFGKNSICINAVPSTIGEEQAEEVFGELLEEIKNYKKDVITKTRERALYTIACKSAIKANMAINEKEMRALVDSVLALGPINTCPHGRPIMISYTKYQMEKQFKRVL